MRLIKIETKGFKSFATKITLDFDGGVVGIVGPNGSGKSNINDAIKWVLGEQSFKSLRGDNPEDIIFSGSKLVKASEVAEVSLTFDNKDKKVNLPHSKIIITRRIKRGESSNQYFINGEPARLKDIKIIAMESGIGKSSLAIISQGTISDIAEATPEERRGIFEEAAGISKYKARKKEALRKLTSTTEALEKVKTVVYELERQVKPLKRQAEKAKLYIEKRDELKGVEVALLIKDLDFYNNQLEKLAIELEGVEEQKASLKENIETIENSVDEKNSKKYNLENEVIELNTKFTEITSKLRDIEISESRASERRQMVIEGQIKSTKETQIQTIKEELESLGSKINEYKIWSEKSSSAISSKKVAISETSTKSSKLSFDIENNKAKLLKLKTKLSFLKDHKNNKSNLYKGVKTIADNKKIFDGYKGLVSEIIKPKNGFQAPIESILVSALQHIVVSNSDVAVKAVNFLKENRAGKATFIPLSSIKPKGIIKEHEMILNSLQGFVARASDVVDTEIQYDILKKFLLGNILIAENVKAATSIAKTFNHRYMVVSKEGDIVRPGGVISGGERGKTSLLVGTDEQIKRIEDVLPTLENVIKQDVSKKSALDNSITEEQAVIAELNIESVKVKEKINIMQNQFSNLKIAYEKSTNQKFTSTKKINIEDSVSLNEEKISIQTLLKAKRGSIISINNDISQGTIQKTEFEKTLRNLIEASSKQSSEKAQAEYIINNSKERLAEEYEMTLESARNDFSKNIDVEKSREIVKALRQEIRELGHVNLDSIEMFEEVNGRYEKLKSSENELLSAKETIVSAINEMDQIIISRLDETVKGVNKEFNNVFTKMFGGGFAEVKYTNPSDLLLTGIDVIAQPPGKTVKNLRLFSGGEKALIAISLLFAVLRSKPLPLCILDEVEAALDEANVVRFAEYLQELKKQTQFIVITHRVGTMSRVDYLFGATMQKRGVTSFFTVKIEEAKTLID